MENKIDVPQNNTDEVRENNEDILNSMESAGDESLIVFLLGFLWFVFRLCKP